MMKQHFVEFYSPGTFVAEQSTRPIDAWNVDTAIEMARSIKERHGAVPYGFRFITRGREDNELDSRIIDKSGLYYLGGRVETVEDVRQRDDPKEKILLSNMERNGFDRIVINENSGRWTQPLHETDTVLDVSF